MAMANIWKVCRSIINRNGNMRKENVLALVKALTVVIGIFSYFTYFIINENMFMLTLPFIILILSTLVYIFYMGFGGD
jgi:heme A synthase